MITYIKIDGFKSFVNFEMNFTPLTVIAGTNASGKSNLFDALKLLSDLCSMDLKNAFTNQRGEAIELFTQYTDAVFSKTMSFEVDLLVDKKVEDSWGGIATLKYTRLKYRLVIERKENTEGIDELYVVDENLAPLRHKDDAWVAVNIPAKDLENWRPKVSTGKRGKPYLYTELRNGLPTIKLPQDGKPGGKETLANSVSRTVLSGIDDVNFPHAFAAREEISKWKFLQLNPDALREPSKKQIGMSDVITQTGQNLAAALYRIQAKDKYALKDISRKLNNLLPNFLEVKVEDDKQNNQYIIKVASSDGKIYSSRVLSEGTLRLLTLCIFLFDDKHRGLLCYEEPENGIHPFRIEALAKLMNELAADFSDVDMSLRQVLINTHSPVLVNQVLNAKDDMKVSVWFSSLNTLVRTLGGEKHKVNVTRINPVVRTTETESDIFPNVEMNDSQRKFTLSQVKSYLETTDYESNVMSL